MWPSIITDRNICIDTRNTENRYLQVVKEIVIKNKKYVNSECIRTYMIYI